MLGEIDRQAHGVVHALRPGRHVIHADVSSAETGFETTVPIEIRPERDVLPAAIGARTARVARRLFYLNYADQGVGRVRVQADTLELLIARVAVGRHECADDAWVDLDSGQGRQERFRAD